MFIYFYVYLFSIFRHCCRCHGHGPRIILITIYSKQIINIPFYVLMIVSMTMFKNLYTSKLKMVETDFTGVRNV